MWRASDRGWVCSQRGSGGRTMTACGQRSRISSALVPSSPPLPALVERPRPKRRQQPSLTLRMTWSGACRSVSLDASSLSGATTLTSPGRRRSTSARRCLCWLTASTSQRRQSGRQRKRLGQHELGGREEVCRTGMRRAGEPIALHGGLSAVGSSPSRDVERAGHRDAESPETLDRVARASRN